MTSSVKIFSSGSYSTNPVYPRYFSMTLLLRFDTTLLHKMPDAPDHRGINFISRIGAMKNRIMTFQTHSDHRTTSFGQICIQSQEILPADVFWIGFLKNCLQCLLVLAVHKFIVLYSIFSRGNKCIITMMIYPIAI